MDAMNEEPDEVPAVSLQDLGISDDRLSLVCVVDYPQLREYDVTGQTRQALLIPDKVELSCEILRLYVRAVVTRIADARLILF